MIEIPECLTGCCSTECLSSELIPALMTVVADALNCCAPSCGIIAGLTMVDLGCCCKLPAWGLEFLRDLIFECLPVTGVL